MTDATRPYVTQETSRGVRCAHLDRDASRLRARSVAASRDPAELAQWLVEVCAWRGSGGIYGEEDEPAGGEVRRRRLASRDAMMDEGDDDDGEDVDEENAVEAETPRRRPRARTESTGIEEDLAAVAVALELMRAATEQLQLKMVLKASEQMLEQEQMDQQRDATSLATTFKRKSSTDDVTKTRPGVPLVGARTTTVASSCGKCSRFFSAFQRGRNCGSCGHLFCPKCVSRQQILPSRFGHGDRAVRVCDLCVAWLQHAMDRYFDAVDLVQNEGTRPVDRSLRALNVRSKSQSRGLDHAAAAPALSPTTLQRQKRMEYRTQRHSIAVPDRKSSSKPWFSGNLRAMHVGDRQPRRKSTTELDAVDALGSNNSNATDEGDPPSANGFGSASLETTAAWDLTETHCGAVDKAPASEPGPRPSRVASLSIPRPPSIVIDAGIARSGSTRRRSIESSEGEEANEEDEALVLTTPELSEAAVLVATIDDQLTAPVTRARSLSKPVAMKKATRKTKFARSASIDFANLNTMKSHAPASPSAASASDANDSVRSGSDNPLNGEMRSSFSASGKKCFDDSDIVDGRRSFVGSSDAGGDRDSADDELIDHDAVDLPATVLRFAVYDVRSKENQGLKLSLGRFGRKNIVLDRYTLEVDCAQAVVRVKSVFMHRFWAFRCDAVKTITLMGSGAVARVFVMKHAGNGYQLLEWEFGNTEERAHFKQAVEELKSRELKPLVGGSAMLQERSDRVLERIHSRGDEEVRGGSSPLRVVVSPRGPMDAEDPVNGDSPFELLRGEQKEVNGEVPATLLIGPAGDLSSSAGEMAAVWGRLRGVFTVTNYRVIFMHLAEHCHALHRSNASAYIPMFTIISTQVVYPGGRRPRSTRAFQSTAAPVIVISCKDARSMRVELEGSPAIADDRSQHLQATINRLADAAQRYRTVKAVDGVSPLLMGLEGFEISERAGGSRPTTGAESTTVSMQIPPPPLSITTTHSSANGSPRSYSAIENPALSPAFLPSSSSSAGSPVVQAQMLASTSAERSDAFAFFHALELRSPPVDELDGWHAYTDEREFKRQIAADPAAQPFLKFYQNARGNVCKSYPSKLLVPASMNSATLMKVAEFRAKNRLPVITYYHKRNRCVLTRSGQPLLGNLLSGSSSLSDQLLLGVYRRMPEIINTQSSAAPSSRPIYIFDARKLKASTGNRLMGKGGVETAQDYPGAVVYHLNIANMYRMQSSYQALLKLVVPGGVDDQEKAWLSSLEATRWLSHVRQVLEGAVKIARVLELEGSSVLVHCSDGWDRTSQLTSLAQIMIDPFYRTIRGFAVVVEKDWCAFGHKFAERLGGDRAKDPQRSKSSPVMFQFLDAVWQILSQFPSAFEFDERFLLHIANALTSGQYGTFLYDSRLDRDANAVRLRTVSVWTPVLMAPEGFRNADYAPVDAPIWPWTSTQMVHLWESYFFQWHPKYHGCRWSAGLVHHNHQHGGGGHWTKPDDQPLPQSQQPQSQTQPQSRSAQRSGSFQTPPSSIEDASAIATESQTTPLFGSPLVYRDRESSGEITGSTVSSARRAQQQQHAKKAPPMHKIFLFKS